MVEKSVKYKGTHIIQKEMPVVNYIDSEQDNVKYQPSIGQEGSTVATFTNTHHPLESDNVEWKKVELNRTRSATDKYNILDQNQSNACEDGTTTGFYRLHSSPGETLTPDTSIYYIGTSSLKCVTPNSTVYEGFGTDFKPATPGTKYSATIRLRGTGSVKFSMYERNPDGSGIVNVISSTVTLSDSWQKVSLTRTFTTGTQISLKVETATQQAATIYADALIINAGDPDPPWVEGPPGDFYEKVKLYGIMFDGTPELIGEHNSTAMYPTATTESIVFDLAGSAGEPPLIKELGSASAGKIKLNLPMPLQNYESLTLKHSPYADGWTKVKTLPVTGAPNYTYPNYVIGPYVVSYDSDMNTDFSDLRFTVWNGTQFVDCRYYIFSKVNGTNATVFVEIPSLTITPTITNIYMFYGNSDATTTSNSDIIYMYDDFEDGNYTGRTSPYKNYTLSGGTIAMISSGQINGNYSLKHTTGGSGVSAPIYFTETNGSYVIEFDFKLTAQGNDSNSPHVSLFFLQWIDASNNLRLYTYWDGTNQRIDLLKRIGGVNTAVASWTTSSWNRKMLVGEQHHYKIINNGSVVTIIIDSTRIIDRVNPSTGLANTAKGFGCMGTSGGTSGVWDNIKIRPYMANFGATTGGEATIGIITSEGTNVSPDSWDNTKQELLFTLSSDYLANSPICFDVDELDSSTYETQDRAASATNIFRLGYDHAAKYHALRVVVETNAEEVHNIKWNYVKYDYSVEA